MSNEKVKNLSMLSGSTALGAVGQLLFKYALPTNSGVLPLWLLSGFVAYGISTLIYFYVLSRVHLSWAYGIGGLSYILATIFAYFILLEQIPPLRWIGVVIITIGVLFIAIS
jgi:uncharacterized membrane protein